MEQQDSPGAHHARAALSASARMNKERDAMVDAVVEAMRPAILEAADRTRDAVRDGLADALTDERTWAKVFQVLQAQAAARTGEFVWGGIKGFVGKAAWVALGLLVLWSMGGWAAVKVGWAALVKG